MRKSFEKFRERQEAFARQYGKEYEFTVRNNYEFSLKRQELRLNLVEEADGFLILSYKGLRYPVEIISQKQNEYEILLNGVTYTFSVETPFSLK